MLNFDTPGPRRRGGDASASLGLSAAGLSVAFSMPDGLIGGRGGKPFKRRTSSFSGWFSVRKAANAAFSFSFSLRSRSTSPINWRTSPANSVGPRSSSESFKPRDIPGLNQAAVNAPLPPGYLPRLPPTPGKNFSPPARRKQLKNGRPRGSAKILHRRVVYQPSPSSPSPCPDQRRPAAHRSAQPA